MLHWKRGLKARRAPQSDDPNQTIRPAEAIPNPMITAPTNKISSARVNTIVLSFTSGVLFRFSTMLLQCNIGIFNQKRIAILAWLLRAIRNALKLLVVLRCGVTDVTLVMTTIVPIYCDAQ